jgi:hypothetical protein
MMNDTFPAPNANLVLGGLDGITPQSLGEVFERTLRIADEAGAITPYRVLDGGVSLALDGLWYYSSQEIHCEHCVHQSHGEKTTYYHSAVAGAIVRPGNDPPFANWYWPKR